MQVEFNTKNLRVPEKDVDYVYKVINGITKYARRVSDEASSIIVKVEKLKVKTSSEKISLIFTLYLPRNNALRVEEKGVTVQAAADKAFNQLKVKLEKYKTKKQIRRPGRGVKGK
jgi:ribosomal subunit interface protein